MTSAADLFRVGNGAGFSGDRIDAPGPVVDTLIARGGPAAIFFEVLGERTIVLAQLEKRRDPARGYEPMLERLLEPVLEKCLRRTGDDIPRAHRPQGARSVRGRRRARCGGRRAPRREHLPQRATAVAALREGAQLVNRSVVTEQLLYEVHDPAHYITPDVALDFTGVRLREAGRDRVEVLGVRGKPAPERLKATACFEGGWLGEGEISLAGPNCLARARSAADVLLERLRRRQLDVRARVDLVGVASVHDDDRGTLWRAYEGPEPAEIRVRLATSGTHPHPVLSGAAGSRRAKDSRRHGAGTGMNEALVTVPLHAVAHSRAGDKGNRLNLSLIAYHPEAYALLAGQVTEAKVLALFAHRGATRVKRYDLPRLHAFNFVIDEVLEGGVNASLNVDGHGKTHSFRLLAMPVRVPRKFVISNEEEQ